MTLNMRAKWLPLLLLTIGIGCSASQTVDGATVTFATPTWIWLAWLLGGIVAVAFGIGVIATAPAKAVPGEPLSSEPLPSPDEATDGKATGTKKTEERLAQILAGVVLIIVGLFFAGGCGVSRYREKVVVDDSRMTFTVGGWESPIEGDVPLDQIVSIHMRFDETGRGRNRSTKRYADITMKSGAKQIYSRKQ